MMSEREIKRMAKKKFMPRLIGETSMLVKYEASRWLRSLCYLQSG